MRSSIDYLIICRKVSRFNVDFDIVDSHSLCYEPIEARIAIDGIKNAAYCINPHALVQTFKKSGKYEVLTCSCGIAECADIWRPFTVLVDERYIVWKAYYLRPRRLFVFDARQYRSEIESKLKAFIERCKRFECARRDAKDIRNSIESLKRTLSIP